MGNHGNSFISFPAAVGAVGGWVELARTTLGSAGDSISVASLADKQYYMVLHDVTNSGVISALKMRINGISTTTYAFRESSNGGADGVNTTVNSVGGYAFGTGTIEHFSVDYWANLSAQEKLMTSNSVFAVATGSGSIPNRHEMAAKNSLTTNPINEFDFINNGAGSFATGSEMVVLGWDPSDTHTNNFWEELDSTDFSGSASTFTSGTFTAKKYLWVQCYIEGTSSLRPFSVQFNSDTGANYAIRRSHNGAGDAGFANTSSIDGQGGSSVTNLFWNMFIINNSANEKLCNIHSVSVVTQGAGTPPLRDEIVGKWDNTSSQITTITVRSGDSGNITTGKLRVWGSN